MRHQETEVKIRIANLSATRKRMRELGFSLTHRRSLEDNLLFDTPDRSLRKVRSILRLRHYGTEWLVTFKGTPAADPHYKSRLELEMAVLQPQTLRAIFEALGFVPVFRYQKIRSHYAPPISKRPSSIPLEVALDETPIGNFMEIEGTRPSIDRVAALLGYSKNDYTTASYGALYLDDCRKKNLPPGDMLFPTPGKSLISRKTP